VVVVVGGDVGDVGGAAVVDVVRSGGCVKGAVDSGTAGAAVEGTSSRALEALVLSSPLAAPTVPAEAPSSGWLSPGPGDRLLAWASSSLGSWPGSAGWSSVAPDRLVSDDGSSDRFMALAARSSTPEITTTARATRPARAREAAASQLDRRPRRGRVGSSPWPSR
jgi:hypothetical protein